MQFEWNSCKNHFRQWWSSPRTVHVFYDSFRQSRLRLSTTPSGKIPTPNHLSFCPRHAGMPGRHTIDRHHSTHYTLPFKLSKVTHCCSHLCDLSPERPLVDEGISLLTLCSAPLLSRAHLSLVSERSDPKLWVRVSYRFEFECVFVAVVFFAPSVEHYCATCANGGYLELNCIWERNLTMSMTYFEHF